MNIGRNSIRAQLLFWLLVPTSILLVAASISTYVISSRLANQAYDEGLADTARAVASRVKLSNGKPTLDIPPSAIDLLKDDSLGSEYFQVRNESGEVIAGDGVIGLPAEWPTDHEYRDGLVGHQHVRIYTMRVVLPDSPTREAVLVQAAEATKARESQLRASLLQVILPVVIALVLIGSVVWVGVRRGLAPLDRLTTSLSQRSPRALVPLNEADAPLEVRPLVSAINALLTRVEDDISRHQRFIANAAHQLRTPLAGLRAQAELALRQTSLEPTKHILKEVQSAVDRASRLVRQLLSLSRAEPGGVDPARHTTIDIRSIAREVTQQMIPEALRKEIDLGFEERGGCFSVRGDEQGVRDLVVNLVENAVRYTPHGGNVTVRVTASSDSIRIAVEDSGPGIPENERDRVLERFYRVPGTTSDGSGLGLAIVREVVSAHQGELVLGSGPEGRGNLVTVGLPAADA